MSFVESDPAASSLFNVSTVHLDVPVNSASAYDAIGLDWSGAWGTLSSCSSVKHWKSPCDDRSMWDDFDAKCLDGHVSNVGNKFIPWTIYDTDGCESGVFGVDDVMRGSVERFKRNIESGITVGLEYGIGGKGLRDSTDISGGLTFTLVRGISRMLDQWSRLPNNTTKPVLHAPMGLIPYLDAEGILYTPSSILRGVVDLSASNYNTIPASGSMEPLPPWAPSSGPGSQLPENQFWVYMTPKIEVAVSTVFQLDLASTADAMKQNSNLWINEAMVAYRFDPCVTLALVVEVS